MTYRCVTSSPLGEIKRTVSSLDPLKSSTWYVFEKLLILFLVQEGVIPQCLQIFQVFVIAQFIFRTILKFQGILFSPVLCYMNFINPLLSWKQQICFFRTAVSTWNFWLSYHLYYSIFCCSTRKGYLHFDPFCDRTVSWLEFKDKI